MYLTDVDCRIYEYIYKERYDNSEDILSFMTYMPSIEIENYLKDMQGIKVLSEIINIFSLGFPSCTSFNIYIGNMHEASLNENILTIFIGNINQKDSYIHHIKMICNDLKFISEEGNKYDFISLEIYVEYMPNLKDLEKEFKNRNIIFKENSSIEYQILLENSKSIYIKKYS